MKPNESTAHQAFLDLALEVSLESCPTARAVTDDFQILLPHATWNLARTFEQLRHASAAEQRAELVKMVQALLTAKPLPTDPEALRQMLVPRVTSLSVLLRKAYASGWDPITGPAPFFQLDWFLGIDVVARDGDVLHHVAPDLAEWGLSLQDVVMEARQQHPARRYPEEPAPDGSIAGYPIHEQLPELLLFDLDRGNNGVFLTIPQATDTLVLLCSQDQVYGTPNADDAHVDALLQLAEEAYPRDKTLCLLPYVAPQEPDPTARLPLMPWFPSADHPHWARVQRMQLMQHYRDWELLRPDLTKRELERGARGNTARHVTAMQLMDHPTNACGFTTYTVWSAAGGIFPNYAGEVVVLPTGSTTGYVLDGAVVYEVLAEVAHALPHHCGLAWIVEGGLPASHLHILSQARATIDLAGAQ